MHRRSDSLPFSWMFPSPCLARRVEPGHSSSTFATFCVVQSGPFRGDLAFVESDVSSERSIRLRVGLEVDIAVDPAGHDVDDRDVGHGHDIAICRRERFCV